MVYKQIDFMTDYTDEYHCFYCGAMNLEIYDPVLDSGVKIATCKTCGKDFGVRF